ALAGDRADDRDLLVADGAAGELGASSLAGGGAPLVLVAVAVLAAEVRLVHFDHARERGGGALHGRAPAAAHVPNGGVGGDALRPATASWRGSPCMRRRSGTGGRSPQESAYPGR